MNLIIVVLLLLPSRLCSQILSESQILQITRLRFSSHHELIFYRAVFSVPGCFRYQRHPNIETRVFSIWYCKLPIPVCLDYSFAQDVVFTSVLLLGFTAILNGSLLHWWNKKKQDPVRRQELLAPYFENVDVEVEEDSGSEHDRNGRAHRKAWLDLGDKHPDFQYVI